MQIALFGGSFDPPHQGHFQVALHLLEEKIAQEVWFIPTKKHPFGKQMLPDNDRVAMLENMIADNQPELIQKNILAASIKIDTYELHQDTPSYSYETLHHFASTYSDHAFSWVIGSDNVPSFPKWYHAEELLKEFPVLVYPRPGYGFDGLLSGMRPLQNLPTIDISSTDVRERVKSAEPINTLVSPGVAQYIQAHQLYR
jgi:nicotinate-nucleotide adenylyltransferase